MANNGEKVTGNYLGFTLLLCEEKGKSKNYFYPLSGSRRKKGSCSLASV